MDKINKFELEIMYKPGKDNSFVDSLCRRPNLALDAFTIASASPSDIEEIKEGYTKDSFFVSLFYALNDPDKPVDKSLATKAKRYRMSDDGLLYFIHDGTERLCIPKHKTLRDRLLKDMHDCRISGHLGIDIVYEKLSKLFFWPRMDKTVKYYIASCDTCQRTKPRTQRMNGLIEPHDVPPYPFHTVAMDLIVELPKTRTGFHSIVVFICKLSKFTYMIPLKNTAGAKEIATAYFDTVFRFHGFPSKIVSDRDARFTSAFWKELQTLGNTKINFSTSYHPQTDGETERRNRTIEQVIRAFINRTQSNWDELLSSVEFALNSAIQSGTQHSPIFLVCGHEPIVPASFLNPNETSSSVTSVNDFLRRRQNAIQAARDYMVQAQDYMAAYVNRSRNDVRFEVGDKVMVHAANLRSDFDHERPSSKLMDI